VSPGGRWQRGWVCLCPAEAQIVRWRRYRIHQRAYRRQPGRRDSGRPGLNPSAAPPEGSVPVGELRVWPISLRATGSAATGTASTSTHPPCFLLKKGGHDLGGACDGAGPLPAQPVSTASRAVVIGAGKSRLQLSVAAPNTRQGRSKQTPRLYREPLPVGSILVGPGWPW
jgi:hypothetical protein